MATPQRFDIPDLATVEIDEDGVVTVPSNGIPNDVNSGSVFYCSTEDTSESRQRIASLLEALHKHPDGTPVLTCLMKVLPENHRHLQEFVRPEFTLLLRICSWMLPPAPESQYEYNFGDLRRHFHWWHYVAAIPMLTVFLGLIGLQAHFFSWMIFSPLTATIALGTKIGGSPLIGFGILLLLLFIDRKLGSGPKGTSGGGVRDFFQMFSPKALNEMAVYEEQIFREGAENWKKRQRLISCLTFGLIHLSIFIYPFAMSIPHVIMGGIYMRLYLVHYRRTNSRHEAVLRASVFHRLYNRVAIFVLISTFIISLWYYTLWPLVRDFVTS